MRPFRFAATLTACQLITSLVKIHGVVAEARDKAAFQYDAEVKKAGPKKQGGDQVGDVG